MSTVFGEKISKIKKVENLSRPQFCKIVNVPIGTMRGLDSPSSKSIPKFDIVEKICKAFPQYTLWLMTDQVNPEAGQISPEIKQAEKDYQQQGQDMQLQTG